jgi:hypothetical protein
MSVSLPNTGAPSSDSPSLWLHERQPGVNSTLTVEIMFLISLLQESGPTHRGAGSVRDTDSGDDFPSLDSPAVAIFPAEVGDERAAIRQPLHAL